MILIPALITVVLFGLLPLGVWIAEALAPLLGVPPAAILIVLFAGSIALGAAVISRLRAFVVPDRFASEDALGDTGTNRGQEHFLLLAVITLALAGVVFLAADVDPARFLLTVGAVLVAFIPAPVRATSWPPSLPIYRPPSAVGQADVGDEEQPGDEETIAVDYSWRFFDSLSELTDHGSSFAIRLAIRKATYEEFRSRPHPEPGQSPKGYAVLAKYVREGVTAEVRRCARLLGEKSVRLKLRYLDLVSFVLAFTSRALEHAGDEQTHGQPQYTNYPIETLMEKRGDCEDFAVLAAALLRQLGVDALLWILELSDGSAHAAVGVRCGVEVPGLCAPLQFEGHRYYYCEATPAGSWRFGEIPPELAAKARRQIPVPLN